MYKYKTDVYTITTVLHFLMYKSKTTKNKRYTNKC